MAGNSLSPVRVICGPTAAGKSRVAMWLATQFDGSIVSADSRQLYRGFDIGTAKPALAERQRVPHFGVDVLEPTERSSSAWWAAQALGWIALVEATERTPIVVGGTGFYLRGVFGTFFEEPKLHSGRRRALQNWLASRSVAELHAWTRQLDPDRAHLGRTQLLRAVEIALLTGERISDLHQTSKRAPNRDARYLVVDPGPRLAGDIERRVHAMVDAGWLDEVRWLDTHVPAEAPAWNASGYSTIRAIVQGSISAAQGLERIVIETRQYAKRQRTWFRHQLAPDQVTFLDPTRDDWTDRALVWWNGALA